MSSGFEIGDTVQLNSGGPVMTITVDNGDQYTCQWFVGKKAEMGFFPPKALIKVDSRPEEPGYTQGSFV